MAATPTSSEGAVATAVHGRHVTQSGPGTRACPHFTRATLPSWEHKPGSSGRVTATDEPGSAGDKGGELCPCLAGLHGVRFRGGGVLHCCPVTPGLRGGLGPHTSPCGRPAPSGLSAWLPGSSEARWGERAAPTGWLESPSLSVPISTVSRECGYAAVLRGSIQVYPSRPPPAPPTRGRSRRPRHQ